MNKSIILGITLALSLAGVSVAHAADSKVTNKVRRQEVKEVRQEVREVRKDKMVASSTREVLKNEIESRKQAREVREEKHASSTATTTDDSRTKRPDVSVSVRMAQNRLSQNLGRLNDIKSKIDSRIAKLAQAGANVSAAQADLALAVTALGNAQAKVAAITVETAKQSIKDAQEAINAAQRALVKVTSDLRGAEASVKANASSTAGTR